MNKDKILFGVLGLAVGIVIGFLFANSVNRSAVMSTSAVESLNSMAVSNSALPPNHPPIGAAENEAQGGALPQVTAAIDKARSEPNNFEAQMTAGDLYYQIQRFDDAVAFYERAKRLRPDDNEPVVKLGNTHFDAERYEEAERWYIQALKRTPNDVNIRTDLGLTFFLRTPADVDRAIKEYIAALVISPDSEIALQNLALAYKERGDDPNLQKTLDKLAQVNPNNPVVLRNKPQ